MKRLILATAMVLSLPALAFAWGGAGGDGTRFAQLQETAVVVNNSGGTLSSGAVVVWDTSATAGSTLGSYVTTTTSADAITVAGVVQSDSVADGFPCKIVTRGPIQTQYAGSTDGTVTAGGAVGSTTVAGQCGTGTNLGITLQTKADTGADYQLIYVFVSPTNGD